MGSRCAARHFARAVALAGLVLLPAAATAQTGMMRGKVVDAKGQPLEGVRIVIAFAEGVSRKLETKTNRRGEFIQIGLASGAYKVTAEKDGLAQTFDVRVTLGRAAEVNFVLAPGSGPAELSKEEAAKREAFKGAFDLGVAAAGRKDHDEAIAKFTEALGLVEKCFECHYNIGVAFSNKKDYAKAEAAFKAALALKTDYVDAYNGLAAAYNAQRKFDEAAAASAEAAKLAGGATGAASSPDVLYNQAVIAWNAGRVAEARGLFEQVVQANPGHADAQYQLGLAYLNEGKMAEAATAFESYLKAAPDGQHAPVVKAMLQQIKK
jgi:tetratricopeptide (TPR) repeat protein